MAGGMNKEDGALERGAGLVAAARGELDQELGALRGKLASIGSQWQGGGSAAFQNTMVRWDESAKKITSALDEFETNLRGSEQTYNATDEAQQSTFTNFDSRLG